MPLSRVRVLLAEETRRLYAVFAGDPDPPPESSDDSQVSTERFGPFLTTKDRYIVLDALAARIGEARDRDE